MKRLILLLFLLVMVPPCERSWAQCTEDNPCPEVARLIPWIGGGVPVGGETTYTLKDTISTNGQDVYDALGADPGIGRAILRYGCSFTPTATYTVTKIEINVYRVGSPSFNVVATLYSTSGGLPSTLRATSDSRAAMSIDTSETYEPFIFGAGQQYEVQASTVYAFALEASGPGDGVNNISIEGDNATADEDTFYYDLGSWNSLYENDEYLIRVYTSP